MTNFSPTELEGAVLHSLYENYGAMGFPALKDISIKNRLNTGAGRIVDLSSPAKINLEDGYIDLLGRYIQMLGVPNGLMATAMIEDGRLVQLEFSVYGEDEWDGEEREWSLI